jgi:RNA polymerase sigma-70 factor (ECF subfamily)
MAAAPDSPLAGPRQEALEGLVSAVHDELRRIARAAMRHERPGHTLDSAGLVNETYIRLSAQRKQAWPDRASFLAAAATVMRRVLVDHARARNAEKRGGSARPVPLQDVLAVIDSGDVDILALDEALADLARIDPRKARVVELRFFGGLTAAEASSMLDVPLRTIERDWTMARAWLRGRLMPAGTGRTEKRAGDDPA